MERWFIAMALVMVLMAGITGLHSAKAGRVGSWTSTWMALSFLLQLTALGLRGEMRGTCPLKDTGEVLLFIAWSLSLFYLLIGPTYRISLLGLFSTPIVSVLLAGSLYPGALGHLPALPEKASSWHEAHAALSVISYGSLALAAVAGSMFLTLDRFLKNKDVTGGVCETLPSIRHLHTSMKRLLILGLILLSAGVVTGFIAENEGGGLIWRNKHFIAALAVWGAYTALLCTLLWRGLAPKLLAILLLILFGLSMLIFTFV